MSKLHSLSLKQQKTIEALPKTNYNIGEAMRQGGYTYASSRSGTNYRTIRSITQKMDAFNPEKIKERIMYTYRLSKKKKDLTNMNRNIEHQAKIAGLITDKSEVDNKHAEKVIIVYGSHPTGNDIAPIPQVVGKDVTKDKLDAGKLT